ncbi:MAG: DUF3833 family protein [Chitinophagaceae bacterium]|nr:DUF3833 family protein [Chitinophagaceae bacterium]
MNKGYFFVAIMLLIFFSSCSTIKPIGFVNSEPKLDPVQFFGGKTHSSGVMESHGGKPVMPITTATTGIYKDGVLSIEQDLYPGKGKKNHRSWKLKQIDEHHVEATANDIAGTARGMLYGNYFTWTFTLKLDKGLVRRVRMNQQLYLMPNGQTLIIRSIIRKFGIIVQQITEEFKKD